MNEGYYLAEACENTFLIFDYLNIAALDEPTKRRAHASLIKENRDDAMILIDGQASGDTYTARMLVLGVDGEMGEFCGNGSRACAAYLFSRLPEFTRFFLKSNRGIHQLLRYADGTYSTRLPPINFTINEKFIAKPGSFLGKEGFYSFVFEGKRFYYADAIEPHLVIEEEVDDKELLRLGRLINQQKELFPLGINVNSIRPLGGDAILVRTYERGVQRLTRSCGTGSCCSAAWFLRGKTGMVNVTTLGGHLTITVLDDAIELRGPATIGSFCN
jgi:diaminopimelate epimerase